MNSDPAKSGIVGSAEPLAWKAASLIKKETNERRILQRRTVSIERPTSNVEWMYSVF